MSLRQIRVVGAVVEREPGSYLITQRSKTSSLPLKWEFPGGKVEPGEDEPSALRRELEERLGLEVEVGERMATTRHGYDTYEVEFSVYRCRLARPGQVVSHARVNDHRWVKFEELARYEFPDADAKTVKTLLGLDW